MERETDICASCVYDQPGYCSVIGTIPHCCDKHWHCKPGSIASDYKRKEKDNGQT